MNQTPPNIKEIYKVNRFVFENKQWFSLEDMSYANELAKPFCIITGYNPNNCNMTATYNKSANQKLITRLQALGLEYIGCIGGCFGHYEDSFCVFGISLENALELGKEFGQYSIFYFQEPSQGHYYDVETSSIIV